MSSAVRAGSGGGDRFARHWYDLVRLDDAAIADEAIADTELARDVAHHKQLFFAEKGQDGEAIDYSQVVSGGLLLAPEGAAREALGEDYAQMVADGLILGEAPTFDTLMDRCAAITEKPNATLPHSADDQG